VDYFGRTLKRARQKSRAAAFELENS